MGWFLPNPHTKDNTTMLTYGQLDDLVEHDIWRDMEIEDEVLKGKEQSRQQDSLGGFLWD